MSIGCCTRSISNAIRLLKNTKLLVYAHATGQHTRAVDIIPPYTRGWFRTTVTRTVLHCTRGSVPQAYCVNILYECRIRSDSCADLYRITDISNDRNILGPQRSGCTYTRCYVYQSENRMWFRSNDIYFASDVKHWTIHVLSASTTITMTNCCEHLSNKTVDANIFYALLTRNIIIVYSITLY